MSTPRVLCIIAAVLAGLTSSAFALTSQDAYVIRKGTTWVLGTAKVERTLKFSSGGVVTTSWKSRASGWEMLNAGLGPAAPGSWTFVHSSQHRLAQGEIQLDVTLRQGDLEATRSYVVYPGSSIIREWVSFRNAGETGLRVSDPEFLNLTAKPGPPESVDFHWMTGGSNVPGSWMLKTEKLRPGAPREFDSYDPFGGTAEGNFLGDGVLVKVLLNDRQIWPAEDGHDEAWGSVIYGWAHVASAMVRVPLRVSANVAAGDRLRFIVNAFGTADLDATAFAPTIAYANGESHTVSKEFGEEQGGVGWQYAYADASEYVTRAQPGRLHDLVYSPTSQRWIRPGKESSLFIAAGEIHPGAGEDATLVWIAPKAGRVRIVADLSNPGNNPVPAGGRRFQMGSNSYAPWNSWMSRDTGEGVFLSWDYFGHWASRFLRTADGSVNAQFRVAGYDRTLQPGESVTMPKVFAGLFQKDLDNAGNECLDWQYRYLWDYTRQGWFPAIRMLGWWSNGTPGQDPGNTWVAGNGDIASAYRKVFRVADLMREVGADVYHRDWGWWDRAGDWNGPDFSSMGAYLRKHGMGQLIYAFIYTVDAKSKVAREHPDWVVNGTLDMSKPEVVEYLKWQLDQFRERFGPFEWRNDSVPTVENGGGTSLLGQDQGLREIIRHFLDKHPDSAFQAVNGGGNLAGCDYVRYASALSFSDGAVGLLRNQWASLFLPPDKSSDIPDVWQPGQYDKALWRGLLTINFDMTGDTWNLEKIEGIRELIDIYHYLESEAVVGRWVHVHRPLVSGDEPTMYFERLSRDGKRGIIIPKRTAPGSVTIRPKGLNPRESYLVTFQEAKASQTRTGASLMAEGIKLDSMQPGELIYLNLPFHPGNTLDKVPPSAPGSARKAVAANMGYPGVEVAWTPGRDDHWVSYYEILRNDIVLDKVAKGTFYFDHSAAADVTAKYQIRTVDGAELRSKPATAEGPQGQPALVLDDAQTGIAFAGKWQRETGLQPAYNGTISRSEETGASFSFAMEGAKFTWFTKLCHDCGKAEISIDDQREAVIDTYSADDIWGVGVYSKTFPAAGKHTVKISVLGEHGGPRGNGHLVFLDGVRIEAGM